MGTKAFSRQSRYIFIWEVAAACRTSALLHMSRKCPQHINTVLLPGFPRDPVRSRLWLLNVTYGKYPNLILKLDARGANLYHNSSELYPTNGFW